HRLGLPARKTRQWSPRKKAPPRPLPSAAPKAISWGPPKRSRRGLALVVDNQVPTTPDTPIAATDAVLALTLDACRYLFGDPAGPFFGFCGSKAHGPYCDHHHNIAYQSAKRRRR